MMKPMWWAMCLTGLVTAALLASGCIHASMGNMR